MTSYRFFTMAAIQSESTYGLRFSDSTRLGTTKSICTPNFVEISQSEAELLSWRAWTAHLDNLEVRQCSCRQGSRIGCDVDVVLCWHCAGFTRWTMVKLFTLCPCYLAMQCVNVSDSDASIPKISKKIVSIYRIVSYLPPQCRFFSISHHAQCLFLWVDFIFININSGNKEFSHDRSQTD